MRTDARKDRTISLRLSETEFESLKAVYAAHGARSISEFIRAAMHRIISESVPGTNNLDFKIQEIEGKLSMLDGEVARLGRLLDGATEHSHL